MLRTVFESLEPPFVWLDLVEPTRQDLDGIARVHAGLRSAGIDELVLADFECRLVAMHAELDRRLGDRADTVC